MPACVHSNMDDEFLFFNFFYVVILNDLEMISMIIVFVLR